jgi:hypothetical protein
MPNGLEKMLKRKVRLKITNASRLTFRLDARAVRASCASCGHEVELMTETAAAGVLRVNGPALGRLITDGRVHTIKTINGTLWVCKDSLLLR